MHAYSGKPCTLASVVVTIARSAVESPGCPAWTVVPNTDSFGSESKRENSSECFFNSSVAIWSEVSRGSRVVRKHDQKRKKARQAKSSITMLRIIQTPTTFQPVKLKQFFSPGHFLLGSCSFGREHNGYLVGKEAFTN